MHTKAKSNVSENSIFQFFKIWNSFMCSLHLLCVFISMVDKFEHFNASQKIFLTEI